MYYILLTGADGVEGRAWCDYPDQRVWRERQEVRQCWHRGSPAAAAAGGGAVTPTFDQTGCGHTGHAGNTGTQIIIKLNTEHG